MEMAIIVAVVAVAVGLHALFQKRFTSEVLRRHNDVAGFLFSAVGVIYAVVLGFVVVVVWEKYDTTVGNVETEIASVSDLYRTVAAFPEPQRSQIRAASREYTREMIAVEWPAMARGAALGTANASLEAIAHLVDTFLPKNEGQSNAQQAAIEEVERLLDARRLRLVQLVPSVPGVLWFALSSGAVAMLAFAFLFGSENRPAQLVMTAILAGLIGVLFVVISEFDTPFSGSVTISNDGWVMLQSRLPQIQ